MQITNLYNIWKHSPRVLGPAAGYVSSNLLSFTNAVFHYDFLSFDIDFFTVFRRLELLYIYAGVRSKVDSTKASVSSHLFSSEYCSRCSVYALYRSSRY